jgi:hypothetical protein
MREAIARVEEHCVGRVFEEEADGAVGKNDPREECEAKSPDESCAGACAAARKESTEGYAEDCAIDQRLCERGVNCGNSECPTGSADEETNDGESE